MDFYIYKYIATSSHFVKILMIIDFLFLHIVRMDGLYNLSFIFFIPNRLLSSCAKDFNKCLAKF